MRNLLLSNTDSYETFLLRDAFVYAASADIKGVDPVTRILGEVILRPMISTNEVNYLKNFFNLFVLI